MTGIHGDLMGETRGLTFPTMCFRLLWKLLLVRLPVFPQRISPVEIASAHYNAGMLYQIM